jgi:hypothetical protein
MLGVLGRDSSANTEVYSPTLAHFFMRVCHDKGLLRRVYTQNIDGLDYKIGAPSAPTPATLYPTLDTPTTEREKGSGWGGRLISPSLTQA